MNIDHETSLVSKTGEAAPVSDLLDLHVAKEKDSEEELLRRKQVSEFVSKLSAEQLALHQKRVQEYFIDQKQPALFKLRKLGISFLIFSFSFYRETKTKQNEH